jgi:hypothetical protein
MFGRLLGFFCAIETVCEMTVWGSLCVSFTILGEVNKNIEKLSLRRCSRQPRIVGHLYIVRDRAGGFIFESDENGRPFVKGCEVARCGKARGAECD